MTGILHGPRRAALAVIAAVLTAASLTALAESYRALVLWAEGHGLHGLWAVVFPLQIDVFLIVGELALFVALVDRWPARARVPAWVVTLAGLAVSVAGNVGHVAGHSPAVRATAAIPPVAAASALAVGLGVLKRVVERHHEVTADGAGPVIPQVAHDAEQAARAALAATIAAGNPLSQRQLIDRFGLTRTQASKVRQSVTSEANGHTPAKVRQSVTSEANGHTPAESAAITAGEGDKD